MIKTIENIPASEVSRVLAEKGIPADNQVTVLMDEDMADIAARMRKTARARGMTDELFKELTKDL